MRSILRRVSIVSLLTLGLGGAGLACSSEVCDEAVTKMRSCLDQLNCNNVDPLDRTKCTSAKSAGEDAVKKMDGVPCVADVSTLADQINKCNPNPGNFCKCL